MLDYPKRVCAVTVPYPGVRQWLEHGHRMKLWNYVLLKDEGQATKIEIPECEWIILGAWHPFYEQLAAAATEAGIKVAVAWSSSATEMEHSPVEIEAVHHLRRNPGIKAWLTLQPDLASLFQNGIHLPAPVHVQDRVQVKERNGIGFYAPATLKKNIFAQLIAVRMLQKEIVGIDTTLYHNLASFKPIMDSFDIKNVLEPWVEGQSDHLRRVASRSIHMAASHAESFCYGAMDACMMGVPVVGSPTIPWLPNTWRTLNPNSPTDIKNVARWILKDHDCGETLANKARTIANQVAATNNAAAGAAIEKLLALP